MNRQGSVNLLSTVSWQQVSSGFVPLCRFHAVTVFIPSCLHFVFTLDIMDKDLKELRNARWEAAFAVQAGLNEDEQKACNRKATSTYRQALLLCYFFWLLVLCTSLLCCCYTQLLVYLQWYLPFDSCH